jgi:type IV pilus assembly protein PilM
MNLLHSITRLLTDPPPKLAFELSEAGISMARLEPRVELEFQELKPGVISVSPLRDNIQMPDELAATVRGMAPATSKNKRWDVALVLPDNCARTSVLDFDQFPSDAKEQQSLVRFRLKKSVPFDVDSAMVSYYAQPRAGKRLDVVAVIVPLEVVARYEAPFRAAGMNPGTVTTSSMAALNLIRAGGISVVAKITGRVFTVMVLQEGLLKLVRCLELTQPDLSEVAMDLFPTFVYIEDNLGAKADRLLLCGFGARLEDARRQFEAGLEIAVEPVDSPLGAPGENNAGLLGYLQSVAAKN